MSIRSEFWYLRGGKPADELDMFCFVTFSLRRKKAPAGFITGECGAAFRVGCQGPGINTGADSVIAGVSSDHALGECVLLLCSTQ